MSMTGTQPIPSRNQPCPCGSGKKFKRCCGMGSGKPAPAAQGLDPVIRLYQQGKLQAAEQQAMQLLRSQPDNITLIEIAAAAALQLGHTEQAVARFRKQIQLQPGNALAHSNLCMALHELGRDEEAYLEGQQAVTLDPELADAWNNLGNIFKKGNHLQGALEHYEKALQLDQSDPRVHVNAGTVSQLLGDLETAELRYREAIRIYPAFSAAWNNLATALQRQEKFDAAEAAFHKAINLQPDNPETLTNYGSFLLDRGNTEQAREHFDQAIRLAPHYVGAYVGMGNLYDRLHDRDNATRFYDKALELDPENSTVHCNIAFHKYEMGEQQQAVDHFVRALKNNPNSTKGLAGLGKAMLRQDEDGKAEEYINKAIKLAPMDVHAHIAKALLLESQKQRDEAETEWHYVIEHYPSQPDGYIELAAHYAEEELLDKARELYRRAEQNNAANLRLYHSWSMMEERVHNLDEAERLAGMALEINASYPGLNVLHAKLARRRKDYEGALALLEQIDQGAIENIMLKSTYCFELGAVYDKLKRYPEAFAAYDEANQAKNRMVGRVFDPEEDLKKFTRWKTFFSKERWAKLSEMSVPEDNSHPRPVFIVGFPRSGTSLLEQILGSHPQISPAGELAFINELASHEGKRIIGSKLPYPAFLQDTNAPLDEEKLKALRDYYLDKTRDLGIADVNTRWVTDKMPHNAIHLGMLALLFPKSPIIHISRHPLNSCLSAFFSNFMSAHRYTSSLESTAQHYRNVMEMLGHYREIGINFLEIHYEDLVLEQEATTRQVLEYIGAPWDDACLQHHKSDRVVRTASYEQVTQKVYTSSLYRYRNYHDAVQSIIPILDSTIKQFGYTTD